MSADTDRFKRIIEEAAKDAGFFIKKWNPDDDDRPVASLGRFLANADDDKRFFDNAVCCEQCGSFYDESFCPRCEEFE